MEQGRRSAKILHQQLEILKEEKHYFHGVVDDFVKKIEQEVESCINGHVEQHRGFEYMSVRLQQATSYVYSRSLEFADIENLTCSTQPCTTHSPSKPLQQEIRSDAQSKIECIAGAGKDSKASQREDAKIAIIEEAVYSLKQATEKIKENNETVEKTLKDHYIQQSLLMRKIDLVSDSHIATRESFEKTANKSSDAIKKLESNLKVLEENVMQDNLRSDELEEEIQAIRGTMSEMNFSFSCVQTASTEAAKNKKDFNARAESLEWRASCAAQKMEHMEATLDTVSSQCKELATKTNTSSDKKFEEFYGMICQLLAKKMNALEELRDIFNRNLTDGSTNLMEIIESTILEVLVKTDTLRSPATVGFSAWTSLELTAGIEVVGSFRNVNFNFGSKFDPSNGKFTAPLSGVYIISFGASDEEGNPFRFVCYKHVKDDRDVDFDVKAVCVVTDEKLVTCFTDLKAGDFLYVECDEVDHQASITINFSCFMLQTFSDRF